MNNFESKMSFKLGFCLGFASIYSQTNKLLSVLTLHYTVLITYCAIKTSAQSTKATGEKRQKNKMI